jgi:hypothetical protein
MLDETRPIPLFMDLSFTHCLSETKTIIVLPANRDAITKNNSCSIYQGQGDQRNLGLEKEYLDPFINVCGTDTFQRNGEELSWVFHIHPNISVRDNGGDP